MFGLIVAGRPVDAASQAITETQYAFRIAPTPPFNHIVVFILPGIELPSGSAATVYVQIPPSQEFKLLGGVGPGKESAIFKLSGVDAGTTSSENDTDLMTDEPGTKGAVSGAAGGDIVVGLSIEPAAQVESQLASLQSGQATQAPTLSALVRLNTTSDSRLTTKELAQRIIGNAFNFLASFGSDTVPLKAFRDWWVKFEKKIELDPSFLEREEQG